MQDWAAKKQHSSFFINWNCYIFPEYRLKVNFILKKKIIFPEYWRRINYNLKKIPVQIFFVHLTCSIYLNIYLIILQIAIIMFVCFNSKWTMRRVKRVFTGSLTLLVILFKFISIAYRNMFPKFIFFYYKNK